MEPSISLYYCVHNFLTIVHNFSFVTLLALQKRLFNIGIYYEIIRAIDLICTNVCTCIYEYNITYAVTLVTLFAPTCFDHT